jgi:glc operon protein GlcG
MPMTLEAAETIIEGAIKKAEELGIKISTVVLDEYGHLIALRRMDGCRKASWEVAKAKAMTSANFHRPSEALAQAPFFSAGPVIAGKQIATLPGGLPVHDGDKVIGGVASGGGTGEEDAECTKAGLEYLKAKQG